MRGMPHALIGLSCGLLITGPGIVHHPEYVGLAVLGSLLPDIDHPGSTIGRMTGPVSWIISRFMRHRGPTHSLLVTLLVSLATGLAVGNELAGWAIGIGYVSHLFADALTLYGVPVFWPHPYMLRLRLFRSGSLWEWPISIGLLAMCLSFTNLFAWIKI